MNDDALKNILQSTKIIACVGISSNPVRPSFYVARYLTLKGFRVIGVNPGLAGQTLFGETVTANLADISPQIPVDMVDIFRRPEAVPAICDEAVVNLPHLRTIWMQIGIEHLQAAAKARDQGINVVENRCPKIEYQRLFGELRMGGFNTGVISSRR